MEKSDLSSYDLSGYITSGDPILKEVYGKQYCVQYYQGEHENEYTIMEMKDGVADGKAQLFQYGIMKLGWTMKQGKRSGVLAIYNEGRVEKEVLWSNFEKNATEERVVWNDSHKKKVLTIKDVKTGKRIYRGECNEHLERHGFGIAYHNETGYPQYSGYFKDDLLFHIYQQVLAYTPINPTSKDTTDSAKDHSTKSTSTMDDPKMSTSVNLFGWLLIGKGRMVEYGGDSTESNTELIKALPVYIGECVHYEEAEKLIQHGTGKVINMDTGICEGEFTWLHGVRQRKVEQLYNGWNCKCNAITSLRMELVGRGKESQSESKPYFSFGTNGDNSTPAFSFGKSIGNSTTTFSFGEKKDNSTTNTDTTNSTPAFSFGTKNDNSFSTTTTASTGGFNFQTYQNAFGFNSRKD